MRVDKLNLERIFERTERLEAPLFQRPYVWKRERNWEPLWGVIRKVADIRSGGQQPRPCFLGAIVLDQLKTSTGKLHARQIIDGQQRLTTLQLAIAAACDLCAQKGEPFGVQRAMGQQAGQNPGAQRPEHESRFSARPTVE